MPDPPSPTGRRRTVEDMDNRDEVRDFLTTRRERLTPEQAGVPFFGGKRRVKGLRREEVAMLAGISTDYYTRLERGNLTGVSDTVLDALARALQLDEAERAHLFNLAGTANTSERASAAGRPAAGDPHGRAPGRTAHPRHHQRARLRPQRPHGHPGHQPARPRPVRRRLRRRRRRSTSPGTCSSTPARRTSSSTGTRSPATCVAALRAEAGRNPYDRGLTDLVGELSTRSEEFRTWWAAHRREAAPHRRPKRCTTRSPATSSSPAKRCTCPATRA